MRVWIVSEGEPLPSDGENVRLRRMGMLSMIMAEQGHEVHWFSSAFHHYKKEHRSSSDLDILVNEKLTVHLIKTKGYKRNVSLQRIFHHRKISEWLYKNNSQFKKPDIIIATLAPLELAETTIKFANENQIPVVIDIRDLWPDIFYEVVPKWSRTLIKPYINYNKRKLKELLSGATSIIGVTPKFLEYGLELAGRDKREADKVFYTSYKPQVFSCKYEEYENEWNEFSLRRNDFIVTFLGNFGRQFEFKPILEAAEILKNESGIKFVLCGLGESYSEIKEVTKDLPNVIMPGWIEKNKINSLLAISSVGIAPYKNIRNFTENTPNKFGEYLSASLPILLGINGVMADLLKEYKAGVVYRDGKSLASILKDLSLNSSEVEKLARNANLLYEEKFNADNVYNELSHYLSSMANTNKKN